MRKKDADAVLSLRVPAEDAERLQHEAKSRGTTISKLARQALASGLRPAPVAPLSYGIADQRPGVTLSVSVFGASVPEARTSGGLSAEVDKP
jgi:hypothetical protein